MTDGYVELHGRSAFSFLEGASMPEAMVERAASGIESQLPDQPTNAVESSTGGHIIYLFAGSNRGGERAAAVYSLLGTAKLYGITPNATCNTSSPTSLNTRSTASKSSCLERAPTHAANRTTDA